MDIQRACGDPAPGEDELRGWITAALSGRRDIAEVCVRLVTEDEMAALNRRYRGKTGSTNILSFPAELPPGIDHPLLGDIVICPAIVNREAQAQGKPTPQHWMHMLVHGCLHLLGYDHVEPDDAHRMETLETEILQAQGVPCPYTTATGMEARS